MINKIIFIYLIVYINSHMSNNIWGYQGLQTPLENLTRGDYNVADYTNMRKEFNARLQALENQGGFIPANVNIQGYCNIVPGTNGYGNFSVTGTTILGGTLSVSQNATFSGNVSVAGVLSISNVSTAQVTANSAVISGNITSTSGQFIGNGAGLTGITSSDPSKLPLAGGTLTGTLTTRNVVIGSAYSLTTSLINVTSTSISPTATINVRDSTTSDRIALLPNVGGGTFNYLTQAGDSLILAGNDTLDVASLTIAPYSNNLSGVRITPVSTFIGTGGASSVPTAGITCQGTSVVVTGSLSGNGAGLTGVQDNTKLPLAGGTLTGSLGVRNINVVSGFSAFNFKGDRFSSFSNSSAGSTFTVTQLNSSVHDYIRLEFNSACTVNLVNLVTTDNYYYQDQQRFATITKRNMVLADYAVTVSPPSGYTFFSKVAANAASYSIPLGVFSVTFLISSANGANVVDVISAVTV